MISALILSAALMTPSAAQDDLLPDTQPAATTVEQALTPQAPAVANATPPAPTQQTSMSSAAVSVDAYRRNYEGPKDSRELSYDSGLLSALRSKESQIGNMEGSWVVAGADGQKLLGLELRSENAVSGRIEGAWRSMLAGFGMNSSGFVSDINMTGRDMEVTYYAGGARSPTLLHLTQGGDALWRGYLLDPKGIKTPVTMSQVRMGN
ncbi:hypothetical protein [Asticcacaulis taihuensis]|uniref:DUF1579 domain-containing protein n=1 Tax=Asticcacaulis taihuensis TaxID=260084 RepID=A0A1G4SQJ8_9CAUL|nr:hypothetical protein [Asticcacaulis taihuensis]SCW70569.1 hypothetical protein SAMN02927928_2751 [Asticcacaulis taihuensis]